MAADTGPNDRTAPPEEERLQSWNEIAAHMKRGDRTVQRWEKKGLPVYRHAGTGNVYAYRSELDSWSKPSIRSILPPDEIAAAEVAVGSGPEPPAPEVALSSLEALDGSAQAAPAHSFPIRFWLKQGAIAVGWCALAAVLASAVLANSYGVAILMLWVGAIFMLARLGRTLFQRVFIALYLIAAMAYTATATTMPEFQEAVINSTTLTPSSAFLFVLGLKFIPLFVLVLGYAIAYLGAWLRAGWHKAYIALGIVFLGVEVVFLGFTSGDDRVWMAGWPGRWNLLIACSVILGLNLAVWLAGRRYFQAESISNFRPLVLIVAVAYLGVAVAAFFVDHEQNLINRYYLDMRWPEAYVAANPDAIRNVPNSWLNDLKTEIGPDLAALLNDPGFLEALHHGRFYKQHSDEPFQLRRRTVMYAYRPKPQPRSAFITIRFPKELADALRFEPIGITK